ncbi:22373_t:CDS:10 [Entrophospora sp. SA101]|nr:22369_t:CDS:10 [Entrophospora sp. SA101]CAJ0892408.1 22373_t:CDS:10 [Entrophospora sp. SA101]
MQSNSHHRQQLKNKQPHISKQPHHHQQPTPLIPDFVSQDGSNDNNNDRNPNLLLRKSKSIKVNRDNRGGNRSRTNNLINNSHHRKSKSLTGLLESLNDYNTKDNNRNNNYNSKLSSSPPSKNPEALFIRDVLSFATASNLLLSNSNDNNNFDNMNKNNQLNNNNNNVKNINTKTIKYDEASSSDGDSSPLATIKSNLLSNQNSSNDSSDSSSTDNYDSSDEEQKHDNLLNNNNSNNEVEEEDDDSDIESPFVATRTLMRNPKSPTVKIQNDYLSRENRNDNGGRDCFSDDNNNGRLYPDLNIDSIRRRKKRGEDHLRLRECFSDDNGRTSSRYRDNRLKLNKLSHLEGDNRRIKEKNIEQQQHDNHRRKPIKSRSNEKDQGHDKITLTKDKEHHQSQRPQTTKIQNEEKSHDKSKIGDEHTRKKSKERSKSRNREKKSLIDNIFTRREKTKLIESSSTVKESSKTEVSQFKDMQLTNETTALGVLTKFRSENTITNADAWTLFEINNEYGLERPFRDWECVARVIQYWEVEKSNALVIKKYAHRNTLSLKGFTESSSPTKQGWLNLEGKKGKWQKRYFNIRDGSIYHSKDLKGTNETFLCALTSFDVYTTLPKFNTKAPTKFIFVIKSQDKITMFENPEDDYMHVLCANNLEEMQEWILRIRTSRNYLMREESPATFSGINEKKIKPTINLAVTDDMSRPFASGSLLDYNEKNPPLKQTEPENKSFFKGSLLATSDSLFEQAKEREKVRRVVGGSGYVKDAISGTTLVNIGDSLHFQKGSLLSGRKHDNPENTVSSPSTTNLQGGHHYIQLEENVRFNKEF